MIEDLYKIYLKSRRVSTDTRRITPGSLFFSLKGTNFNANKFAAEALEKGASYAVVDDSEYARGDRFILVDDALNVLQQLATHHRKQLEIPVIGLTGSNGKTTTKELIGAVLDQKYSVLATMGNLNNHIGVPLTLLSITPEHEIAIIEMGANHQGEIAQLCRIALPSHGMITNIGKAHLEGFGGIEGVIKGKTEMYTHLKNHNYTVWVNSNSKILREKAKIFDHPLFYPGPQDYYHCEFLVADPQVTLKTETGNVIHTQLIGAYNFENIAAALCIGKYFNVPSSRAEAAVARYNPTNNRSQIIRKGTNTIILDAYNANPTSMTSALENLFAMPAERKVVILGDMKELGNDSEFEHRKIGKDLKNSEVEEIYLFGEDMKYAAHEVDAHHFTDKDALLKHFRENPVTNATILLKGSRSMGLETLLAGF